MSLKNNSALKDPQLTIAIAPQNRNAYLNDLLVRDGLTGITEDQNAAYCALSLTSTPDKLKPIVKQRQALLANILNQAGISAYDPGSSPTSPDLALTIGPEEIYRIDKSKVVSSRFFVSLDLLPSTGTGVEAETARVYNRIAVILHDKKVRTSRMQPNRTIHLSYDNFEKQQDEFVKVFLFLKQFTPGIGFHNDKPVLLGCNKDGSVVDLEEETYNAFPHLTYTYDGTVPNAKLVCDNLDIFV